MFNITVKRDGSSVASAPAVSLSQRGRAGMEILGSIQVISSRELRPRAQSDFEALDEAQTLSAQHACNTAESAKGTRSRILQARKIADTLPLFRLERFLLLLHSFFWWNNRVRGRPASYGLRNLANEARLLLLVAVERVGHAALVHDHEVDALRLEHVMFLLHSSFW